MGFGSQFEVDRSQWEVSRQATSGLRLESNNCSSLACRARPVCFYAWLPMGPPHVEKRKHALYDVSCHEVKVRVLANCKGTFACDS
mmetsp:Transcript_9828/g.30531  ORF Transcript_9828/g.30531 Transcript_9828/m.30531 type:complete len:86 (+) Transcript_9828:186-443(+)